MADSTINGLTALTGANVDNTADQFAIWDNSDSTTKKITRTELLTGIPAGTVSAPSVSFNGDANTGVFSPSADTVGIVTGGTQRVTVSSGKAVGVNNTSLKTWNTDVTPIQVGDLSVITNESTGLVLGTNFYTNTSGANVFISASTTSGLYWIGGNSHYWYRSTTTPSANSDTGTTLSLKLDSSGRLIRGGNSADTTATDAATMVNLGNFAVQYAATTGNYFVVKPGAPLGTVDLVADARTGDYPDLRCVTSGAVRLNLKKTGQLRFVPLSSDPAGAEAGDVYYNSSTNKLKCYDGTSWNDLF